LRGPRILRGRASASAFTSPGTAGTSAAQEATAMMDVILILVSVGFFGLSWLYVVACDRL
jgi:hypothetical protein